MTNNNLLLNVCRFALGLAFIVIVIGAYTRLSAAGLGCPDWPGCYGRMIVSNDPAYIKQAEEAYPQKLLEQDKAWIEMLHRYVAGLLGLLILSVAFIAWLKKYSTQTRLIATVLLLLVAFQSLLGMWTVTLLLKPLIVVMHLLGGMTILSMLFWLNLHLSYPSAKQRLWTPAVIAFFLLLLQIALGGWVSTNYSALACPDFPSCQGGKFWPAMDFKEGFTLWHGLGINYEGGVLSGPARTAIHVSHRIGAMIVFLTLILTSIPLFKTTSALSHLTGIIMLTLLLTQVVLGVLNVVLQLPLFIAVAHNATAALLLLCLVALIYQAPPQAR